MGLSLYKKKRSVSKTPEPFGGDPDGDQLHFVIQKHDASHLHYDFRLEMDGVLKSWAVPKGPSLNPKDKRLAMMVEDHPYDYKDFAGVIPSGYGAGIVEIWDEGTYSDLENSDIKTAQKNLKAGVHAGNLKIRMYGKKLKGKQDNAWLLIKHNDEYATSEDYNSENETPQNSPINKWLAENKPEKDSKPAKASKKKAT